MVKFLHSSCSTSAPLKGTSSNKSTTDSRERGQAAVEMDTTLHTNEAYKTQEVPDDVTTSGEVATPDDVQSSVHKENKGEDNYYELVQ